jgi:hypothetical protein
VAHALRLLVAITLVTLFGCGGEDADAKTADSAPLSERVLTAEDAPGSKPDPEERSQKPEDLLGFVSAFDDISDDLDIDKMTSVFEKAGFEGAALENRFYGKKHTREAPHVSGHVVHLRSEKGATSALDWLEEDIKKPCPHSCVVQRSEFEVDDIPDARGWHMSASAADIKRIGSGEERPFDGYWVGFTDGPYAYTVYMRGPPGSVSEEKAVEIATAYYERVAGS